MNKQKVNTEVDYSYKMASGCHTDMVTRKRSIFMVISNGASNISA